MTRIEFRSRYRGVNHYTVSSNGTTYEISHRTSPDDSVYRDDLPIGYVRRLCNDPIDPVIIDLLNDHIMAEYAEYKSWHVSAGMPDSTLQPPPIMATALNPAVSIAA